jgi:hypothetical protein
MNKEQEKVWEILENGPKTWVAEVIEDPDDPTQCILTIPSELLERMEWSEGDSLNIDTTETGCIILSKI